MKANELRIGNYHLYHIVDKCADPQEWDEICQIDAEDLVYLAKNKGHNYKPIPITEEWLLKFGFHKINESYIKNAFLFTNCNSIYKFLYKLSIIENELKYVHQLQNLYFALTGEELIIEKP